MMSLPNDMQIHPMFKIFQYKQRRLHCDGAVGEVGGLFKSGGVPSNQGITEQSVLQLH